VNPSEERNGRALVQKSSSAVGKAAPGAKRVLSGMVKDTLALAKPIFTVLLGDSLMPDEIGNGLFGELVESVIKSDWQKRYSLKFIHFKREAELFELAKNQPFDLIFLYVSNVEWATSDPRINKDFSKPVEVLSKIKNRYGKPIIATQIDDLRQSFEGTGIIFLHAPLNIEELRKIIRGFVPSQNKFK
jgi:hypothetical protein